jgi:glycosyltransferase involved in cell wall biosynthesis
MDRLEVNKMLYEIREKSNGNNTKEFFDIMEDLFKIKPVTMLYFNVKAKLLCDASQYEEAIELLTVTTNLILLDDESLETCKIFQRAFSAVGKETLSKQWSCMEQYVNYYLKQDKDAYDKIAIIEDKISKMQNNFLNGAKNQGIQLELANLYYESWYSVEGTVMYALSVQEDDYKKSLNYEDRIRFEVNHTFLVEQLLTKDDTYVLLTNKEDYNRTMTIAKALTMLKKHVFVIMPSVSVTVEYEVDLKETAKISMDNIEIDNDGITKITPLDVILNYKIIANNTNLILESLSKKTENDFLFVLGSANIFTSVNNMVGAKKRMQRLSEFRGDLLEGGFAFGYYGKYTSYISKIYELDVQKEIDKPSEYEFSIVIPVRNSAESLRYTLKTCLEQRGMSEDSYEIVVSDNSNPDYIEVEKLVKKINNPKIKYYRTPRNLVLNRSFEYAFIKARGEFVFSIGADDAVLPWGLETLKKVLNQFKEEDVLQWDRGFFVWDSKGNMGSQEGQFIIPMPYKKTEINVNKIDSFESLLKVLINPVVIYGLPMLYINSGFRRRYFNKMLEQTGRLWDGSSQDVYMGMVNLYVNKYILYIKYPITIAGMTCNSIGFNETKEKSDVQKELNEIIGNRQMGVSVTYGDGLKFNIVNVDISLIYFSFFRILTLNENNKFALISSNIEWKDIFMKIVKNINYNSIRLDYYSKLLRYSAYKQDNEFGEWFDKKLKPIMLSTMLMVQDTEKNKYYQGFTTQGGLQLDAGKFGVKNIHEATKLFENISNL